MVKITESKETLDLTKQKRFSIDDFCKTNSDGKLINLMITIRLAFENKNITNKDDVAIRWWGFDGDDENSGEARFKISIFDDEIENFRLWMISSSINDFRVINTKTTDYDENIIEITSLFTFYDNPYSEMGFIDVDTIRSAQKGYCVHIQFGDVGFEYNCSANLNPKIGSVVKVTGKYLGVLGKLTEYIGPWESESYFKEVIGIVKQGDGEEVSELQKNYLSDEYDIDFDEIDIEDIEEYEIEDYDSRALDSFVKEIIADSNINKNYTTQIKPDNKELIKSRLDDLKITYYDRDLSSVEVFDLHEFVFEQSKLDSSQLVQNSLIYIEEFKDEFQKFIKIAKRQNIFYYDEILESILVYSLLICFSIDGDISNQELRLSEFAEKIFNCEYFRDKGTILHMGTQKQLTNPVEGFLCVDLNVGMGDI